MAYFALRLHENPSRDEKSHLLTSLNHFISLTCSENNMMPVQKHFTALVMLFKCLLTMVSVAVSLNFGLIAQSIVQHQRLQVQISETILEKNHLIRRYKHARRRSLVRKRRNRWKNPGRTDVWWTNAWRGFILDKEWLANFRMS